MRLALLLLALAQPAVGQEDAVSGWLDLWTRCRLAVESGYPPRTDDLRHGTSEDASAFEIAPQYFGANGLRIEIHDGQRAPDQIWRSLNEKFWLMTRRWDDGSGTRVACDVRPIAPLSKRDREAIKTSFMTHREALMAGGTHEALDLPLIPPAEVLGVGSIARNPEGNCTASTIAYDVTNDWFSSGTGEQLEPICRRRQEARRP